MPPDTPHDQHADGQAISIDEVRHIARLARLDLDDVALRGEHLNLRRILGYIDRLQAMPLDNVKPFAHVGDVENTLAPDEPGDVLDHDRVMELAPETMPPYIAVPKVLGEGGGA